MPKKPKPQKQFPPHIPIVGQKQKPRDFKDVFKDTVLASSQALERTMNIFEKEYGENCLSDSLIKERFMILNREMANAPAAVLAGVFTPLFTHEVLTYKFGYKATTHEQVGVFCVRNEMIQEVHDFINERLAAREEAAAGDSDDKGGE